MREACAFRLYCGTLVLPPDTFAGSEIFRPLRRGSIFTLRTACRLSFAVTDRFYLCWVAGCLGFLGVMVRA